MIPEQGRRPDGDDRAPWDPDRDRSPVRFLERRQAFAAFAPFVVTITMLFGIGQLDSATGSALVAAACFLGAGLVAVAWLKNIAIPFVTKGRLASDLTIQDSVARRRERQACRPQRES